MTNATDGYARWAPLYDDAPNPLLAREERYLLSLLGDVRNKMILDLACGTGRWMENFVTHGARSCVGIDCSIAMLDVAARKRTVGGKVSCGTCECLPFGKEVFDLAICSFAIGHFVDIDEFGIEVSRVCRPGADVFITDLHPSAYEQGWRVGFRDQKSTTVEIESSPLQPDEICAAFASHGFALMRSERLWLEEPERSIFALAGRADRFEWASSVPAILTFHFQRPGA